MDTLPLEIIPLIINNIDGNITIIASMVCKLWDNVLWEKCKFITDISIKVNDSYMLNHDYENIDICNWIPEIKSHNCLNFVAYIKCFKYYHFDNRDCIRLIKRFCKTNNANISKYYRKLYPMAYNDDRDGLETKFFTNSLNTKSFDVANYFAIYEPYTHLWFHNLLKNDNLTHDNKQAIDYLILNNLINIVTNSY